VALPHAGTRTRRSSTPCGTAGWIRGLVGPGYGGGGAMSTAVWLCLREGNKWDYDWISRVWGDFVGWEALLDCRAGSLGPSAREEEKAGKFGRYVFLSGPADRDDIPEKSMTFGR